MARALGGSVARARRSQQPGLNRQLRCWLARELRQLRPVIADSADRARANRYRKHFTPFAHVCLLIFHVLTGSDSLRQSHAAFAQCRGLVALSGLSPPQSKDPEDPENESLGVSYSQFAGSNTSRPAAFLGGVIPTLIARVQQSGRMADAGMPTDLHLIDSTVLRLSLLLAPWLPNSHPSDVPAVRLHVQYTPALDLPDHILLTDTRVTDRRAFDKTILDNPSRLAQLRHHTIAFDLGFYGHLRFARLLAAGVHIVTRLLTQATVRVEADLPVQQPLPGLDGGRITVLKDQRVTLGSAENSAGAVLPGMRLVTARVEPLPKAARQGAKAVIYQILTDRWDLRAVDVIQIYLWRWQIELFLRWLKSHVHLPHLLGYSRNAVELTVHLAIVVHLLSVLAAWALGRTRRSPALLSRLGTALTHLTLTDGQEESPLFQQLALPACEPLSTAPT